MASIKALLYKSNKKQDGTFPLVIRIIKDRKPTYIQLEHYLKPSDWDDKEKRVKKSHPNSTRLNNLISQKIAEINNIVLEAETLDKDLSSRQVKRNFKLNKQNGFLAYAQEYLEELYKLKKFNQYFSDKPRVKRFSEFLEDQDIAFKHIDISLLKKYQVHLKSKRAVSDRTVVNCLIVIRTIFNRAIEDGIVETKYYPFGKGKIQIKFPESIKIGLTPDEIALIENLPLEKFSRLWHARNAWLVSFNLAGIRVSDVVKLKWDDLHGDRLTYVMGKNKKVVSLKLPYRVQEILNDYKDLTENYVFPYLINADINDKLKFHKKVRGANFAINTSLEIIARQAGVNKKLSMHLARHTFGNIAGDTISPQLLQKLYRHSDLKTTIGYQANFIHKDVDEALEKVLNYNS